jgi:spore coat protein CotH
MMTMTWRWAPAALALVAILAGRADAQDTSSSTDQFFDASAVHVLKLSLHSDDWRRLKETYQENTYYPADVTWNGIRVRNVGIRSRGSASRNERKPGLRVDMNRYVSDQRFLGLKSFVLDNNVQDESFVKERVAMRLFTQMGLPAPRETYARLYVNEEYVGVYSIVESVDKDFIERAYAGREEETGKKERDGYLFDYHWNYPFFFSYLGPELDPYSALFEPQTHESDSPDTLYGPLRDLCRLITETSESDFVDVINGFVDLQQFVRYVAVEVFVAERDGMLGFAGMNNFFLYRLQSTTVAQVIPWDKDQSLSSATYSIWTGATDNALMRRAMAVPALRALYLDTLRQAAALASSTDGDDPRGWLEREIDSAYAQVQESALADGSKPQTNDAFQAEVDRVRGVAKARAAFVTCQVDNESAAERDRRDCEALAAAAAAPSRVSSSR